MYFNYGHALEWELSEHNFVVLKIIITCVHCSSYKCAVTIKINMVVLNLFTVGTVFLIQKG